VRTSILALVLLFASLPGQDRAPESCFPDSSFGVLTFGGLARCTETSTANKLFDLGRRTLARLGHDEAALLGRPETQQTLEHLKDACAEVGISPADLRTLLQGSMALGVGRPSLQALGMPSLCLAIDVHGRESSATALLAKLEPLAAKGRRWLTRDSYSAEGVEIVRLRESRSGFVVSHTLHDGWLLVATGTGYLEECLRALRGQTPNLATTELVRRGRKHSVKPLASLLINARPLARALEPIAPYEIAAIGRSLGIEALEGLYWASSADATGATDVVLIGLPGDRTGLLKAPFGKPCSTRFAALCPSDTLVYLGLAIDREAAVAAAERIAEHLPAQLRQEIDRGARRGFGRGIGRELEPLGVRPEDLQSLADCIGNEAALAVSFDHGVPQVTLMVELEDAKRAETLLLETGGRVVARGRNARLHSRDVEGSRLHFVAGLGTGLSPAFAVRDGVLITSLWRTNVESVLARTGLDQPTLRSHSDLERAIQSAPASMVMHARMADVIAKLYGLVRGPAEHQLRQEFPDLPATDLLPSAEELAAAIGDITLAMGADDAGFHAVQRHPLGLGCLVALTGAGLDWLLERAATVRTRRST
jgi:hypothetical protein